MSPVSHSVSEGNHLASLSVRYHDVTSSHASGEYEGPVIMAQQHAVTEDHCVTGVYSKPNFPPRPLTSGTLVQY